MEYNYTKVRVSDIPQEGLSLVFELSLDLLSKRINEPLNISSESSLSQPAVIFSKPVPVRLDLRSDGQTVEMSGNMTSEYKTLCGRCGEEARKCLDIPVDLIFKPKRNNNDFDDIGYVVYQGEVLDCTEALEELLILSIPHTIYCSEDCKGLCATCGKNLNIAGCSCRKEGELSDASGENPSESPFIKLKQYIS